MDGITNLIMAVAAFVGTHLILSHPLRAPLVAKFGPSGFLGAYSVIGLATFGWVIRARLAVTDDPPMWVAGRGLWDMATLLMLFASVLLAGSLVGNPAAPDPRGDTGPIRNATGVYAITRHPMLWAFLIWAVVHMVLWGSRANLVVSGGILLLALVGMIGQDAKKLALQGGRWSDWMNRTSLVPFAGQLTGRVRWRAAKPGWGTFLAGVAIFLGATWAHPMLGGPVAGVWRWFG